MTAYSTSTIALNRMVRAPTRMVRLSTGVVAVQRAVNEQLADPRQTVDGFDHHRSGDDTDERRPHVGQHRQQRRLQRVAENDATHRQAFGARGTDEVGVQHFNHRATRDTGDAGDIGQRQRHHRQDDEFRRAAVPAPAAISA